MDEKEKKPKKKNIHSGHRHRVRQRFLKENSLESFEELLLFYAYPMKDTNEMAHKLLDTYGSFHNLLAAGADDLMARGNLTEGAAVLISMLPHIARRYENSFYSKKEQMDTFARASAPMAASNASLLETLSTSSCTRPGSTWTSLSLT